ncbi:endonuclease/exonuclease/phosphatase family protein [bacterium]|nr:endonuclease/exonuclease/phosphatase family protein [bacterium]
MGPIHRNCARRHLSFNHGGRLQEGCDEYDTDQLFLDLPDSPQWTEASLEEPKTSSSSSGPRRRSKSKKGGAIGLHLITVNITKGKRAEQLLDETPKAVDVLGCQEVKWTKGECLRMQKVAEAKGWRMAWTECLRGVHGGMSAGTCIFVRIWLKADVQGEVTVHQGRASTCTLITHLYGPIDLYSVNGDREKGLQGNRAWLEAVGSRVRERGLPAIIMGDFNLKEELVANSLANGCGGIVVAPEDFTSSTANRDATVDYYVLTKDLAAMVNYVQTNQLIDVPSHKAVGLRLAGGKSIGTSTTMLQIKSLPKTRPCGPRGRRKPCHCWMRPT